MEKNTTSGRKAESFGDILEDLVREKVQSFIQDVLEEGARPVAWPRALRTK